MITSINFLSQSIDSIISNGVPSIDSLLSQINIPSPLDFANGISVPTVDNLIWEFMSLLHTTY